MEDIMMEPENEMANVVIMEFKVRDSWEEKSLEDTADAALRQIGQQRYKKGLENRGISVSRIRKYAFAFEGKAVLIKRWYIAFSAQIAYNKKVYRQENVLALK